jgi:hypothetical protein
MCTPVEIQARINSLAKDGRGEGGEAIEEIIFGGTIGQATDASSAPGKRRSRLVRTERVLI